MRIPPFVQGPPRADGGIPMSVYPLKQHVRPYWMLPNPTTVALSGVGAHGQTQFLIDLEGHFEWERFVTRPQDAPGSLTQVVVSLFDPQKNRKLMNRPVHWQTLAAVVDRAFWLPEPYLFNVGDGYRSLSVDLKKLDAGDIVIELAMLGRRYYQAEAPPEIAKQMYRMLGDEERAHVYWMTYNEVAGDGTPPTIAIGDTEEFVFRADDNADTDLHKLMVPAGTGDFAFTLRERDTNRQIMNGQINRDNAWGDGEFPYIFPDTYLLERTKELIFTVENLSGAEMKLFATIAGRRLITERL